MDVLTHRPPVPSERVNAPPLASSDARIVALGPGGGAADLVDLPADSYGAELATDLVKADGSAGPRPGS